MTLEEMAEEWVRTKHNILKDCLSACVRAEYKNEIQAYLAGAKENEVVWHILAEEPDVLPKEGQEVKVLTEEGKIEKSTYFYDTYYEEFAFSNIGLIKVFAWCEIPQFKEYQNEPDITDNGNG